MFKNYDLEDLARDVAFEIELGGDRLGPDDVHQILQGIGEKELEVFSSRVKLHALDFSPSNLFSTDFTERMVKMWLKDVVTAENLGRKPESFYGKLELSDDRGYYFVFDDGSVKRCTSATARGMWGKDACSRIIKKMDLSEACRFCFDRLFGDGPVYTEIGSSDFISYCGLPEEGRIISAEKNGDFRSFRMEDGSEVSLDSVLVKYPSVVMDIIDYESDERVYREVTEMSVRRSDLSDFKTKCNELIDVAGTRVKADFLYDEALLVKGAKDSVYIRRDVDDLNDDKRLYIFTTGASGNRILSVTEDIDAGIVSSLLEPLYARLEEVREEIGVSLSGQRMDFKKDAPVVHALYEGAMVPMKVKSVQGNDNGMAMVSGTVMGDGPLAGHEVSVSLNCLSDKSLKTLRVATDGLLKGLKPVRPVLSETRKGKKGLGV